MGWLRRKYPMNGEQTINIVSEIGPIFAMFVVNAAYGITAGVYVLIATTIMALATGLVVLRRAPIMPFVAGAVTITFGALTLVTGDDMWVQIKVTLFNAIIAAVLWFGLKSGHNFFKFVFGKTFHYPEEGWASLTRNFALFFLVTAIANEIVRLGCRGVELHALNHVFKGIDIWVMFKLLIVMPMTGLFSWWQVRAMQKYRLPQPVAAQS